MKPKPLINPVSIILFAMTVIVVIILSRINSPSVPEAIGYVIGGALIPGLLIVLIGWIVSSIATKHRLAGSTTINILLAIFVLSQLSSLLNAPKPEEHSSANAMQDLKSDYIQSLKDSPDSSEVYFDQYVDDVSTAIDEQIQSASGDDLEFYKILQVYLQKTQQINKNWWTHYNPISDSSFMDYAAMQDTAICNEKIALLVNFIDATKRHQYFMKNRTKMLAKQFKLTDLPPELYMPSLTVMKETQERQAPIYKIYSDAHIKSVQAKKAIVELVKNEHDNWSLYSGYIDFYDEQATDRFNQLTDTSNFYTDVANEYYEKFLDIQ